ncbi:MAG: GNAT family N-acetyltransferase [Oscillochloris sp.]|nr:GNAT family N-acetyltransferase [Oscillochloris sp.]
MITQDVPNSSLAIRQAGYPDSAFLAWCCFEASSPAPGFSYWDPLLEGFNTPTHDFLQAVFLRDALAWGHCAEFILVEEAGKPIAAAAGFAMDQNDFRPFRLERLPAVAAELGWNTAQLAQFQQRYEAIWSDPRDQTLAPSGSWTIECVAVIPAARGRGVARTLLQAILARGRELGHQTAGIAVTIGNEPARRLYESLGFQLYLAYGPAYFAGAFPGTIKYRLPLGSDEPGQA